MIEWLQRHLCGSDTFRPDPSALFAKKDAERSLKQAQEVAARTDEIITSVQREGMRNHFIELIYGIDTRKR